MSKHNTKEVVAPETQTVETPKAVVYSVPELMAQYAKEMNAEKAGQFLILAGLAAAYLDRQTQNSVNQDGAVIRAQSASEDVDARDIFNSQKTKMKVGKLGKAIITGIEVSKLCDAAEKKLAAIATTASK